jgi:hypothetical protein
MFASKERQNLPGIFAILLSLFNLYKNLLD